MARSLQSLAYTTIVRRPRADGHAGTARFAPPRSGSSQFLVSEKKNTPCASRHWRMDHCPPGWHLSLPTHVSPPPFFSSCLHRPGWQEPVEFPTLLWHSEMRIRHDDEPWAVRNLPSLTRPPRAPWTASPVCASTASTQKAVSDDW